MLLPTRAYRLTHIKISAVHITESSRQVFALEREVLGSICDVGCLGIEEAMGWIENQGEGVEGGRWGR